MRPIILFFALLLCGCPDLDIECPGPAPGTPYGPCDAGACDATSACIMGKHGSMCAPKNVTTLEPCPEPADLCDEPFVVGDVYPFSPLCASSCGTEWACSEGLICDPGVGLCLWPTPVE